MILMTTELWTSRSEGDDLGFAKHCVDKYASSLVAALAMCIA